MDEVELARLICQSLCDYPADVVVEYLDRGGTEVLTARGHPEDTKYLLGHGGATASAMRTILKAGARKRGEYVQFEVEVG